MDDNALVRRALEELRGHRSGRNVKIRCPFDECSYKRSPSLSVHDDGPWQCHRCGRKGFLEERSTQKRSPSPSAGSDRSRIEIAVRLFERCRDIHRGDPVDLYLRSRRIVPLLSAWWPADLRSAQLSHPDGHRTHAMVAAVRSVSGQIVAVHRTFLTPQGAQYGNPSKMSLGVVSGGAVRLGDGIEVLVVGEGIETTMRAAAKVEGATGWAAISAGNMRVLQLPRGVRQLWVAPDMDDHGRTKIDDFKRNPEIARMRGELVRPDDFHFGSVGLEAAYHLMRTARHAGIDARLLVPMRKDHAE